MFSSPDITLISAYNPGKHADEAGSSFPLGCAYLIASLKRAGYEVEFRDYQFCEAARPLRSDAFLAFLEGSARIVGISCVSSMLPTVLPALEAFKREHPDTIFILGGPGATPMVRPILEHYPAVDIIGIGEGELTLPELVGCLKIGDRSQWHAVNGIAFRQDGQVVLTPTRHRMTKLDELPFITEALDLMPSVAQYKQIHLMMARGCTYECTFCGVAPLWGRRNTTRSKEHVLTEIAQLVEREGIDRIVFADDLFTLVRARVEAFCREFEVWGLPVKWGCHGRINLLDERLMETMARGGCNAIFYGVESGADRIVDDVKVGFDINNAVNIIELSREYFRLVKPSFIWGFPHETFSEFKQTLLLMIYLRERGCAARTSMLIPEPMSPLYNDYKDKMALDFSLVRHGVLGDEMMEQFTPEMKEAIVAHPDIYSVYYYIPHESLADKISAMDRLGHYWVPKILRGEQNAH